MEDDRKRSGWGPIGCVTIAGLVLALALYVSSIGPAARSLNSGGMSLETFGAVYAPLTWIIQSETPPGDWLWAYMNWWSLAGEPATLSTAAPQ